MAVWHIFFWFLEKNQKTIKTYLSTTAQKAEIAASESRGTVSVKVSKRKAITACRFSAEMFSIADESSRDDGRAFFELPLLANAFAAVSTPFCSAVRDIWNPSSCGFGIGDDEQWNPLLSAWDSMQRAAMAKMCAREEKEPTR
jgi:hypothetical protein